MFDAESKSAKIKKNPNSLYGGGRGLVTNFQLLMLSPNLLKSQISYTVGGGVGDGQLPTIDAESNSAKISNFLYNWGGGGSKTAKNS